MCVSAPSLSLSTFKTIETFYWHICCCVVSAEIIFHVKNRAMFVLRIRSTVKYAWNTRSYLIKLTMMSTKYNNECAMLNAFVVAIFLTSKLWTLVKKENLLGVLSCSCSLISMFQFANSTKTPHLCMMIIWFGSFYCGISFFINTFVYLFAYFSIRKCSMKNIQIEFNATEVNAEKHNC